MPTPSYADLVDLLERAPLVLGVEVRKVAQVEPERAKNVATGWARVYVEARPLIALQGRMPPVDTLSYLADVRRDARGKVPALTKRDMLLLARPVPGHLEVVQLVAPDAQLPWDRLAGDGGGLEARVRAILAALQAPDAPTRITGVREASYVPGALVGEGETQIFLTTTDNSPAAISVVHRPVDPAGQPADTPGAPAVSWSVSFSEVVDASGRPPAHDTLAWYRLACFLPGRLARRQQCLGRRGPGAGDGRLRSGQGGAGALRPHARLRLPRRCSPATWRGCARPKQSARTPRMRSRAVGPDWLHQSSALKWSARSMDQLSPPADNARVRRADQPGTGRPLRVALAGLGTVGAGVIRLIETNGAVIARRAGRPIVVSVVSARDRGKDRGIDIAAYDWADDMTGMAARDDVDVVVELVGGADGPALTLARQALRGGRALVTANKAMIAHHGLELAELAEASGAPLRFEAAVAGGVPVIKGLREGAAANRVERVYGILNGTCNFILSAMADTGRDFGDVLAEAQARGYAEADPAFDIEGTDTAHKLSILAALSFGTRIDFASVETSGISRILAADIAQAAALGYVIRLIGMAEVDPGLADDGAPPGLFQRVQAQLVPIGHPLAHVAGATNAMVVEGNFSGRLLFQGPGAGDGPTASAVVADIIDIARGIDAGFEADAPFSVPVASLEAMAPAVSGHRRSRAYIRFIVADRPGVLAEITAAMRDAGVSIESLIQKGRADTEGEVLVAMVTHEAPEAAVTGALALLDGSPSLVAPPLVMHLLAN